MTDTELLESIALEIGRRFADLTPVEQDQLRMWLADVSAEITDRIGTATAPARYDQVRRLAVAARADRPDFGVVATEVGVDDSRIVRRYSSTSSPSMMNDTWWAWLGVAGSGDAFSIFSGSSL